MRRRRLTVRSLMAAVALLALGLGAGLMFQRWSSCRRQAAYHASEAARCEGNARVQLAAARASPGQQWALAFDAGRYTRRAAWHRQLEKVYRRAAWRPWEAIPSVPGEPSWEPIPPEPDASPGAAADPDPAAVSGRIDGRSGGPVR